MPDEQNPPAETVRTPKIKPREHIATDSERIPKTPEIKLETLQAISFELIANSIKLWRTYSEDKDGKGQKITRAAQIHEMVIQAMRFHPDLKQLRELHEINEELLEEYDLAKRSGILPRNPRRTQTGPQPQTGSR